MESLRGGQVGSPPAPRNNQHSPPTLCNHAVNTPCTSYAVSACTVNDVTYKKLLQHPGCFAARGSCYACLTVATFPCRLQQHQQLCLQAWRAQQLQQDLGFAAEQAQQLTEWSHGQDSAAVAERPPPKTLSILMSLTPIPLVMHPSMGRDIAVAGGKAGLQCAVSMPSHMSCVALLFSAHCP